MQEAGLIDNFLAIDLKSLTFGISAAKRRQESVWRTTPCQCDALRILRIPSKILASRADILATVKNAQLTISCEGDRTTLVASGALGVPQAVALKRFYVNAILEGITDFTLDCAECTAMDSTFLGTLTGMALRLKKAGGRFRTQNVPVDVLKQMASLGLSQFLSGGK